jgi:hypothetical protein
MPNPIVGMVGASLGSALIGADAADSAADAQSQSAAQSNALQKEMFDKQIELQEPFRQGGLTAQNRLMDLLGLSDRTNAAEYGSAARDFGMSDFQADPGYGFRMSEGMKALENSAAARGNLLSGSTLKGIQRFGQDLGSQEYQNAFNRFQTNRASRLNPLQSLMGSSQSAANTLTSAAGEYGRNVGENLIGMGNARASGYIGQGNALNSALGQGFNMYQQNQMMNNMRTPAYSSIANQPLGAFWE